MKLSTTPPSPRESFAERIASGSQSIVDHVNEIKMASSADAQKHRASVSRAELERHKDQIDAEVKMLMQSSGRFEEDEDYERLEQASKRLSLAIGLLKEFIAKLDATAFNQLPIPPTAPPRIVQEVTAAATPVSFPDFARSEPAFVLPPISDDVMGFTGPGIAEEEVVEEWECEHCTIRNPSTTRVCSVCYRTSDNPHRFKTRPISVIGTGNTTGASASVIIPNSASLQQPVRDVPSSSRPKPTGFLNTSNNRNDLMVTSLYEEQDEIYHLKVRISPL